MVMVVRAVILDVRTCPKGDLFLPAVGSSYVVILLWVTRNVRGVHYSSSVSCRLMPYSFLGVDNFMVIGS